MEALLAILVKAIADACPIFMAWGIGKLSKQPDWLTQITKKE